MKFFKNIFLFCHILMFIMALCYKDKGMAMDVLAWTENFLLKSCLCIFFSSILFMKYLGVFRRTAS